MNDISSLIEIIDQFVADRDWDQFHSPKNLSMALVAEAGELVEQFQWLSEEESRNLSPEKKQKVNEEIADVLIYTLRLYSKLGIDPIRSAEDKIRKNEQKYPIVLARGNAKKYSDLQ